MRICVSFKDKYKDEFEHASNLDNTSEYICELIRKDIRKKEDTSEEKIMQLLNKIIKNGQIQSQNKSINEKKEKALQSMFSIK
ncbi:hypothetical protein [Anaerosolibacter sp.]|uniref:hypothetical protein n=1 Tax=Anaerosolibacter sp. TaxID=1872527 RepID=UPI0039EF4645